MRAKAAARYSDGTSHRKIWRRSRLPLECVPRAGTRPRLLDYNPSRLRVPHDRRDLPATAKPVELSGGLGRHHAPLTVSNRAISRYMGGGFVGVGMWQ